MTTQKQQSRSKDAIRVIALLGALVVSGQAMAHYGHHHRHHHHNHYSHGYPEMWQPKHEVNWAAVQDFERPMLGDHRLDFCLKNSQYCGRAAANQYCRMQGFRYSTQFAMTYGVGDTRSIGNGAVNRGYHHAFKFIRCRQ